MTLIIGISGPSSSGKSTVAHELSRRFSATLLEQDRFFVDPDHCLPDSNFCDPNFLRVQDFLDAVRRLHEGVPVEVPEIDFSTFRQVGTRSLDPRASSIVIIEGMTAFRFVDVVSRLDRGYYIRAALTTILQRKLRRDVAQRGKSEAEVYSQMEWVASELASDERSLSEGTLADSPIEIVDGEDISAVTDLLTKDLIRLLDGP